MDQLIIRKATMDDLGILLEFEQTLIQSGPMKKPALRNM